MDNQGVVFFYCLLAIVVSVLALMFLRTRWVYFVVGTLLPPMLFIGGDAVWQGHFNIWDDIVFIVLALIAFGITLGVFVIRFVWQKTKGDSTATRS